jgi:predicted small metal-binding protein
MCRGVIELHKSLLGLLELRGGFGQREPVVVQASLHYEREIRADTEAEILEKAAEHARTTHNLAEMPPEVVTKVRAAMRTE